MQIEHYRMIDEAKKTRGFRGMANGTDQSKETCKGSDRNKIFKVHIFISIN